MIFFRYVGDDDDDSEITDHTARKVGPSSDDLGDYVAEQMSWSPTRDDLCEFDATVSSLILENMLPRPCPPHMSAPLSNEVPNETLSQGALKLP